MQILSDKWVPIAVGVVSVLVVVIGVFALSGSEQTLDVTKDNLVREDSQVLGNKDAKVVIVEFSDFQCPACRAAHPIVKQVAKEYGDKILFVYRHFPLISAHPFAIKAAEAAEAAGEQGKFWEYHNILFDNQENLKTDDLKKYAEQLGLDMTKFNDALDSGKFKEKVTNDLDEGQALGVSATPTFFINNEKHQGVLDFNQFKKIIEEELSTNK
jgi:protein-disulfide isomerase